MYIYKWKLYFLSCCDNMFFCRRANLHGDFKYMETNKSAKVTLDEMAKMASDKEELYMKIWGPYTAVS